MSESGHVSPLVYPFEVKQIFKLDNVILMSKIFEKMSWTSNCKPNKQICEM